MDDPSEQGDHPLSDDRSRTHRTLPATILVPTKLPSRLSHRVTLEIALGNTAGFTALLADDCGRNVIYHLICYFIPDSILINFYLV